MSDSYFKKERWEGKPLSFKVKYIYAKYPYLAFCWTAVLILIPATAAIRFPGWENKLPSALKKYKADYIVVRDDDPRMDYIMEQKEKGKHLFPKY